MTEGRIIEDPQIELEQRKAQAREFLDIVTKTARTAGSKSGFGDLTVAEIRLGEITATFEADSTRSGENRVPNRLILERQKVSYLDKGDIVIYRVSDEGVIVRDLAVWDDSTDLRGMRSKDLKPMFPDLKDREVEPEQVEALLGFVRSPLISADLVSQLFKVKDKDDKKTLDDKREELAEKAAKRKKQYEREYQEWQMSHPGFISDPDPREEIIG